MEPDESDTYVLRGGEQGAERLRLLARVKWPTTKALLRQVGLRPGMRCLDVGCGIGAVTLKLARWVGPTGISVLPMRWLSDTISKSISSGELSCRLPFKP